MDQQTNECLKLLRGLNLRKSGISLFIIKLEILEEGISEVCCFYYSVQGEIESIWTKKGKELTQKIKVPVNTKAFCCLPKVGVDEVKIGRGIRVWGVLYSNTKQYLRCF